MAKLTYFGCRDIKRGLARIERTDAAHIVLYQLTEPLVGSWILEQLYQLVAKYERLIIMGRTSGVRLTGAW